MPSLRRHKRMGCKALSRQLSRSAAQARPKGVAADRTRVAICQHRHPPCRMHPCTNVQASMPVDMTSCLARHGSTSPTLPPHPHLSCTLLYTPATPQHTHTPTAMCLHPEEMWGPNINQSINPHMCVCREPNPKNLAEQGRWYQTWAHHRPMVHAGLHGMSSVQKADSSGVGSTATTPAKQTQTNSQKHNKGEQQAPAQARPHPSSHIRQTQHTPQTQSGTVSSDASAPKEAGGNSRDAKRPTDAW